MGLLGGNPGYKFVKLTGWTQGDILIADSTGKLIRLAAGTSGEKLETKGAGSNADWDTDDQRTVAELMMY